MSEQLSTYLNVGGYRYAFLLVVWNAFETRVRDELERQAAAFGADLGPMGVFVQPFPQRAYEMAGEVRGKCWPEEIRTLLDDEAPLILVLSQAFAEFDPREHPYAMIWLRDYEDEPEMLRTMLETLARKARREEDVIGYLHDVAERTRREQRDLVGQGARLASYVEIKPQLFGVSIDLKAIFRDIAGRR
jgi:hypothetical protein